MKRLFAAVLLAPAIALANGGHHKPAPPPPAPAPTPPPKPAPTPAPAPSRGSSNDHLGAVLGVLAVGGIAYGIYRWKNPETGEEKSVEIKPTEDGKGAKLAFSWRHR